MIGKELKLQGVAFGWRKWYSGYEVKKAYYIIAILLFLPACSEKQVDNLTAGPDDSATSSNSTLLEAAREGNLAEVKVALSAGADANARDDKDRTALWHAAKCGDWELVKLLVDAGADIDAKDWYSTPLHIAIEGKHKDIVEFLIDADADVNQRCILSCSGFSCTSLHLAAKSGNLEIVRILLCQDVEMNAKDRLGDTPLHYAVRIGHEGIAELLMLDGANVNALNVNCATPLDIAQKDTLKKLLRSCGAMHAREMMSEAEIEEATK